MSLGQYLTVVIYVLKKTHG